MPVEERTKASACALDPVSACSLDPVSDPRWSDLVERSPDASVFHHPGWLALIRDCYRYRMTAVCLVGADGDLVAGLPIATVRSRWTGTRAVSVPFSDICGPIVGTGERAAELLSAVDAERQHLGLSLEIHADVPTLPGSGRSDRFYHHIVRLDGGPDEVLRRVKHPKRRGATRARKSGVSVARRIDGRSIDAFFRLHVLTRRKLGVPTQPRRFFDGLPELFAHGLGFVLLAEWDGRPIAANVYLRHRSVLTCKYGASDPAHLDKHPNALLQLEAMRIGCESGCDVLDLGRTELANDGLRCYKRELGAEEHELAYTMAPPPAGGKSVRSVSNLQGAVIRRSPPAVGRFLGAAAYRHFG